MTKAAHLSWFQLMARQDVSLRQPNSLRAFMDSRLQTCQA